MLGKKKWNHSLSYGYRSGISLSRLSHFGVVIITLALAACSNVTLLRTQEIRAVTDSVKVVERKVTEVQKSVDELNLSQGGSTSKMRADLTTMLGELKEQITRLQSEIDETQFRLGQLGQKLDRLEQRRVTVGGNPADTLPVSPANLAANGSKPTPPVKGVDALDLEHVFNQAREDYVHGKYELSYTGFKTVFERDQGGSFKELAIYWMGECLYKSKKTDKALEVYQRSLKEFPKGSKACASRFKIGLIYNEAKENDKRDEAWKALIAECPATNESERAQDMMKE